MTDVDTIQAYRTDTESVECGISMELLESLKNTKSFLLYVLYMIVLSRDQTETCWYHKL